MIKRVYFISNRVVLSQVVLLFLTAIITSVIILADLAMVILPFWYIYLLIIPIALIILTYIKRKWIHFHGNWIMVPFILGLTWLSFTIYIGVAIDYNLGIGKTFTISTSLIILYLIGYGLARLIRTEKVYSKFDKKLKIGKDRFRKNLFWIGFLVSVILILSTLFAGWQLVDYFLREKGISSIYGEDYGEFLSCLECAMSTIFMFSGILIVIFWILNYFTLSGLYDTDNASVEKDTPSKLIMIFLRNSMIVMIICWILAEFLIPPIPAGGGKGGGRGSRARATGRGSGKSEVKPYRKFKDIHEQYEAKDRIWDKHNLL
ncbi:MAG: hypothetical protein KAX18_11085 [Candidatus Lokiarchaeota archaeon]|nr:hypothetical protein [Candidatus Lokiarchaeota archaeon]